MMRLPQLDVNRVSLLMFHNLQASSSYSYVPAVGGYARLNFVLVPGLDADVGIVRFDTQLRLAGQVVRLDQSSA